MLRVPSLQIICILFETHKKQVAKTNQIFTHFTDWKRDDKKLFKMPFKLTQKSNKQGAIILS